MKTHNSHPLFAAATIGLLLLCSSLALLSSVAQTLHPGQTLTRSRCSGRASSRPTATSSPSINRRSPSGRATRFEGRFAVAVRPAGTSNETYGVVFFKARTEIDKVNRLVTLEDFQITKVDFPTQRAMQQVVSDRSFRPNCRRPPRPSRSIIWKPYSPSPGTWRRRRSSRWTTRPPRIIYTTQPSLLVLVDGAPVLSRWLAGYERVVNTRAILLLNTNSFASRATTSTRRATGTARPPSKGRGR